MNLGLSQRWAIWVLSWLAHSSKVQAGPARAGDLYSLAYEQALPA